MKNLFAVVILFGFTSAAFADNFEVQVSSNNNSVIGGNASALSVNSPSIGDNSPWGLQAEAYYSLNDNIQIGGMAGFGDADSGVSELSYTLGLAGRYNFNSELKNSLWLGAGVAYSDRGAKNLDSTTVLVFAQAGKRFAISQNLVYSPSVTFTTAVAGDDGFDSGSVVSVNLISFSGFLNI